MRETIITDLHSCLKLLWALLLFQATSLLNKTIFTTDKATRIIGFHQFKTMTFSSKDMEGLQSKRKMFQTYVLIIWKIMWLIVKCIKNLFVRNAVIFLTTRTIITKFFFLLPAGGTAVLNGYISLLKPFHFCFPKQEVRSTKFLPYTNFQHKSYFSSSRTLCDWLNKQSSFSSSFWVVFCKKIPLRFSPENLI